MPSHKYEIKPGFIGPLTAKRTRIRELGKIKKAYRKEQKRISNLCIDGTDNHNWEPWDCGCSIYAPCDLCDKCNQCSKCKKLK